MCVFLGNNIILLFALFCCCHSLQFEKNDHVECSNFFQGNPWPLPKQVDVEDVVKLCQTQYISNDYDAPQFASLFHTKHRIPIYTANKVILNGNESVNPRPSESEWNRVATGLCDLDSLPKDAIYSNLDHVDESDYDQCRKLQAVSADYRDNGMHIDRGHLSPNHINSRNREKQLQTFTLTNAAPQYAEFNENSWRVYECVTEYMIIDLVPGEPVYIITGTYGSALDDQGNPIWMNDQSTSSNYKNPVKVPGYYWKAVCYPGNDQSGKDPWGYAIIEENVDEEKPAEYSNYITLKEFAHKYFVDLPFGNDCMNASFGQFAKVFENWDQYIEQNCGEDKKFLKDKIKF